MNQNGAFKALILIRGFAAVVFSNFSDGAAVTVFNPYFLQNILSPLNTLMCIVVHHLPDIDYITVPLIKTMLQNQSTATLINKL